MPCPALIAAGTANNRLFLEAVPVRVPQKIAVA